jgi:outer membrane protein assembly factor BamB
MKTFLIIFLSGILLSGCNSAGPRETNTKEKTKSTWSLTELWRTDTILSTCESVLYDKTRQLLFVSCINGAPAEKNGRGFISILKSDGTILSLDWVTGLNAPKGMGIRGNTLYVADIDQLLLINIEKAEVIEKLDVEGASFLNDVALGADGRVYFTDSDTGNIWIYHDGTMEAWITEGLERPNGLCVEASRVLLTSSGSSDLKVIDKETGTFETVTTEIGHGDGLEFTGNKGHYLCSSWSGEIFMIFPDFSKTSLLKTSDQEINSADIGFNEAGQVVYVPTFFDNRVVAYKLVEAE